MSGYAGTLLTAYAQWPAMLRLATACGAAVLLNTVYCLAYTYYAGNPETLPQALFWGMVHIAPWVAAVEIGRHFRRLVPVAAILLAAFALSLLLVMVAVGTAPDGFDLVRRVPGLVAAGGALGILALWQRRSAPAQPAKATLADFDWARAAGNYVELNRAGLSPKTERTTLVALLEEYGDEVCRIHRSYVARRGAIIRIDRQGVLLRSGKRLPVGNAYRDALGPVGFSSPDP